MCHILEELQEYAPNQPITRTVELPSGGNLSLGDTKVHPVLITGDQLTVQGCRSGAMALHLAPKKLYERQHQFLQRQVDGLNPTVHIRIIYNNIVSREH